MAQSVPSLVAAVIDVLESRGKSHWRSSPTGERWLDCLCPFHNDVDHPSAGFQPETGVFHCFTCDRNASTQEVAQQLMMNPDPLSSFPPPSPRPLKLLQNPKPISDERVTAEYRYAFPDGTPSHLVRRLESQNGKKRFIQCRPDGTPGLPESFWAVYEPERIAIQSYLLVVEGEKCVQRILGEAKRSQNLPHPISALTWNGGSGSAQRQAPTVAARIKELQPAWVILWPDHDEAGQAAMGHIAAQLKKIGLPFSLVDPVLLGLEPKQDVADYLDQQRSLADLVLSHRNQDQQLNQLLASLLVLTQDRFVFPQSRRPVPIATDTIEAAWRITTGDLPTRWQIRTVHAALLSRAKTQPVQASTRLAYNGDGFYWRPAEEGKCFYVSNHGVGVADDPPGGFLLLPPVAPRMPIGYEVGSADDLTAFIDLFHLDPQAAALIEGWLCATLVGLQTPLLLIRGPAGSGKTSLAKAILAIVEPTIPELDASADMSRSDRRELIRSLEHNQALLLDNVSTMSRMMEDTISKLVTETTHVIRPLYEDQVVMLRMHRSLIATTITWDMFKSDLVSRTVAIATNGLNQQFSDGELWQQLQNRIDRLRGHIFQRCVEYYRRRDEFKHRQYRLRIGDFGMLLATLGYDESVVAGQIRSERSRTVSQNDSWLEAIVEVWKESGPRMITPKTLTGIIESAIGEPGSVHAHVLGRYLAEKAESFKDFGFVIDTRYRTSAGKMYRFLKIEESSKQEELSDDQSRS